MRRNGCGVNSDFTGGYTMSRQKTKADDMRREHYFTKLVENAENAMREYWQEKDAENRLFALEYVTRRGFIPQQ